MTRPAIGRLHVLTDCTLQSRFDAAELAARAAAGGADVVQYREKRDLGDAERARRARAVMAALAGTSARCIVNDDPRLARSCGAHGVHVGPRDASPAAARAIVGPQRLVGATANDEAAALRLVAAPVDYLGVGPVFGTRSKAAPAPRLGLAALRRIVAAVPLPVIAIGSIDAANVEEVLATGAHGVAVLAAVVGAEDPAEATRALRRRIDRACGVAT